MPVTITKSMRTVYNIEELRQTYPNVGLTDEQISIFVHHYHDYSDGGGGVFIWRPFPNDNPLDPKSPSNDDGIFIGSWLAEVVNKGIWVRVFSGYVDMRYYGILPGGADCTIHIQSAINYVAASVVNDATRKIEHNVTNTVFIPPGTYHVTSLTMKSGVTLMGASHVNTQLNSINENDEFMIKLEDNVVTQGISIQNIRFWGNSANLTLQDFNEDGSLKKIKGCLGFATPNLANNKGGLWQSNFKDVVIKSFTGDSIRFQCELPFDKWNKTNQWITMENVFAESVGQLQAIKSNFKNQYHALSITGNAGQFIFTNCQFDGGDYLGTYTPPYKVSGTSVYISSSPIKVDKNQILISSPGVITFNTCTIQSAENGIVIESCSNIKIDGCWFETLERAIISKGNYKPSKAINVLNNLFSYTAGNYGTLPPDTGRVIIAQNSHLNANNNYVIDPLQEEQTLFIALDEELPSGTPTKNLGVNGVGNYFEPNTAPKTHLGYTRRMIKEITDFSNNQVHFEGARTIHLINNGDEVELKVFNGYGITSDYIFVRAQKGNFKLTEKGNLYLGNRIIQFKQGDTAFFMKSDEHFNKLGVDYYEQYNLVAHLPKI